MNRFPVAWGAVIEVDSHLVFPFPTLAIAHSSRYNPSGAAAAPAAFAYFCASGDQTMRRVMRGALRDVCATYE